jgi:glucuronate isomerase
MHPDFLFPADPRTREIARALYEPVRALPIVSPHGHTDAGWFASNTPFADPADLFIRRDHYVFRMLYSQGIDLKLLGIGARRNPRTVWRLFAEYFYLFRGTPSHAWFSYALTQVFKLEADFGQHNADMVFDHINAALAQSDYLPRALFERFNIEVIATTEGPNDSLANHAAIQASGWSGRIVTAYRPDPVVDPDYEGFLDQLNAFGMLTNEDTQSWRGYLAAHRKRRQDFAAMGATSTDRGHPTARTANLPAAAAETLFNRVKTGQASPEERELFRAQMLTEMARMSLDDGLVLQIHPGASRNHNAALFAEYGRDMGADIPTATDYVSALKPLLDAFGNERGLTIIVFTLDESSYARELAPLAGHYPSLRLGPAWWFHDSPEGMRRFRECTTETAGFYNSVGFNDDTRAFLSIPARHDMARRCDCAFLARLVAEHRLSEKDAHAVAADLAYHLVKRAYRL